MGGIVPGVTHEIVQVAQSGLAISWKLMSHAGAERR